MRQVFLKSCTKISTQVKLNMKLKLSHNWMKWQIWSDNISCNVVKCWFGTVHKEPLAKKTGPKRVWDGNRGVDKEDKKQEREEKRNTKYEHPLLSNTVKQHTLQPLKVCNNICKGSVVIKYTTEITEHSKPYWRHFGLSLLLQCVHIQATDVTGTGYIKTNMHTFWSYIYHSQRIHIFKNSACDLIYCY